MHTKDRFPAVRGAVGEEFLAPAQVEPARLVAAGALAVGPREEVVGAGEVAPLEGLEGAGEGVEEGRVAEFGRVEGLVDRDGPRLADDADPAPAPPGQVGPRRAEAVGHLAEQVLRPALGARRLEPGGEVDAVAEDRVRQAGAGAEGPDQAVARRGAADL